MKAKHKEKDFKAVEFMRKRRDEMSELYNTNPEEFWKQLSAIRKKYKLKVHTKAKNVA